MNARATAGLTGALISVGLAASATVAQAQPATTATEPTEETTADAPVPPPSSAPAAAGPGLPERDGGRVGLGLYAGMGSMVNAGSHAMLGVSLRFGGAFTDRVHVLGEFSLRATFAPGTSYEGSLDLGAQVYVMPKLYVRGGFGVKYDVADYHGTWTRQSDYPWLHLVGGAGWDLHRRKERAASVELLIAKSMTDDQDFQWSPAEADPRYDLTVAVGLGVDWY